MRPRAFSYHRPQSLDAAVALIASLGEEAAPYAGGTELLLMLKLRMASYGDLIDLKRVPELARIERRGDRLAIGAMATHARIAADPLVREVCPALARLCGSIANARVRSMGTLGGNLCFAEPRADPPVLLAAIGAELVLRSPRGERAMPADGFVTGPLETRRVADEILVEVLVPPQGRDAVCTRIEAGDHSLVCAAFLPGRACRLRLGYGAGGALALPRAQAWLDAAMPAPDHQRLREIVDSEIGDVPVVDDADAGADYRRHLMRVAVERVVREACAAMRGGER